VNKQISDDATTKPLILASRSPRRIALLEQLGLEFEVVPSEVEEPSDEVQPAAFRAILAAQLKAEAVAGRFPDRLVLGADTIVCLGDRVLGKPRSRAQAGRMLLTLRKRWHRVITGLCLMAPGGEQWTATETTRVRMGAFSSAELEHYLCTDEPLDKAGAYAIQGEAARWVEAIEGDYYNVVGLPLALLLRGLGRYRPVDSLAIPDPPERFAASSSRDGDQPTGVRG
jgi:septum formation protein